MLAFFRQSTNLNDTSLPETQFDLLVDCNCIAVEEHMHSV